MLADKVFLLVDETVSSRILIVSENPAICTELMALMSDEGFENLTVAGNVAVALSCAESVSRSNRQHFDLAILCLDKPTEFAETIWGVRESFARYELPLVVVGEWCESDDFIEVIEAGVIDFIAYPINHYSFIARVKTLLRLRHANSKLQRHQEALHTLTAELEQKNHRLNSILEDIRSDLFVAGELQRSFLPDKQVKYESVEFAWFYQPCATIGGDLINVLPISKRHIAVFVLDVAGHGVSAALLAFAIHR
jgi:sigma-B regulation protein RsbU (phosphoserine phosphatase)